MSACLATADVVRPLRTRILRPGWTDRLATYPEDDAPDTRHLAAFDGDAVVGVGTIYPEAPPAAHRGAIPEAAYAPGASVRLRGMATASETRGAGHGRAVLEGCFREARALGATHLWCNARLVAVPFYERLGLACVGDLFDMPEIGPHYVMWGELGGE
jgi:GNAT superfamily N-acetyltransferase